LGGGGGSSGGGRGGEGGVEGKVGTSEWGKLGLERTGYGGGFEGGIQRSCSGRVERGWVIRVLRG
jgi:hypothetical protein